MIFLTADTHFGHKNIIQFCKRPYIDSHVMDTALIENWNTVVARGDTVYHLGDVGFGDIEHVVHQLNGKIILIRGNHDKAKNDHLFDQVHDVMQLSHGKYKIWLSHYAHCVWPSKSHGALHFFGHSHGSLEGKEKSLDVGVDSHNYAPISIYDAIQLIGG